MNRTHITAMSKRKATRLEKIFATGTGTLASPGTLVVEGAWTSSRSACWPGLTWESGCCEHRDKTARSVVASTANTSGSTTRGRVDLTTAFGGLLTFKMTNGGTGPSAQCVANVLVAHNASQPAAASAGTDWKTIYSVGNGTTASTVGEFSLPIPLR